jgi:hypothetical protein
MYILIAVAAVGLTIFALVKGYIGIFGSAVHKADHPYLYWGQVSLLVMGSLVLIFALARGDL